MSKTEKELYAVYKDRLCAERELRDRYISTGSELPIKSPELVLSDGLHLLQAAQAETREAHAAYMAEVRP